MKKDIFQEFEDFQVKRVNELREKINKVHEAVRAVTKEFPEDVEQDFFETNEYRDLVIFFNDREEGVLRVYLGNEEIYLGCYSYDTSPEKELEDYLKEHYPGFDKIHQYEFYLKDKKISFEISFRANLQSTDFCSTKLGDKVLKPECEDKSIRTSLKLFNQDISFLVGHEVEFQDEDPDLLIPCWTELHFVYLVEEDFDSTNEYDNANFHLALPITTKK